MNIIADTNPDGDFILYRSLVGLLTQSGTNPPTIDIFKNDLTQGVPTFFYDGVGSYSMVFESAFLVNKTVVFYPSLYQGNFPDDGQLNLATNNSDTIILYVMKLDGSGANDRLSAHPLEIRVYP